MPTPEANASSSSVALRNANITELSIDETDSITMTQDQCLDNGHQDNSNNISSSDKVSDDLNNSKNTCVSNGVNSVQEFNVDVNREYSTDLVIVQNRTVDADSPPTGKVLPTTSKKLTEIQSDFANSKNILNNSLDNIDANKIECANNIVADMTVITHQNSSENIRDIIANSEKSNRNSSDSQLDSVAKIAKSDINLINSSKTVETRRNRKLIRSANINECEEDKIEGPIERLNKLRASISNALSEVKGVLKQYSTEQSCEDQNESATSMQAPPPEDGPVRFRFVRKIRRRSVFSEDDETEIPKTSSDLTISPILNNKVIEEVPSELRDIQQILSNENQDLADQNKNKEIEKDTKETEEKLTETVMSESFPDNDIKDPVEKNDNRCTISESEIQKTKPTKGASKGEVEFLPNTSEIPKTKNGKTTKIIKKVRRASIAAVEINQISIDQPPIPSDIKTQRRPSDSGTLVKQTTRIKVKTSDKPKIISNRKAKPKTESSTIKSSQTVKKADVEKTDATLSPTEEKSSLPIDDSTKALDIQTLGTVLTENLTNTTEPTVSVASASVIPLQSTQKSISPAIAESKSPICPTLSEANVTAETSVDKLNTSEVVSVPVVSSTVNTDLSDTSQKVTEVNTPAVTSIDKLNTSEVAPAIGVSSTGNTDVPQTSPAVTSIVKLNITEVTSVLEVSATVETDVLQTSPKIEGNIPTGTNTSKLNTPEVPPVPAVSTKAEEMPVTPVKNNTITQQSPEATKVGIPNQQTKQSKQLSQVSKTGTSNKKSNTPASSTKTPNASTATAKVKSSKSIVSPADILKSKLVGPLPIQWLNQTKINTEVSKTASVRPSKKMQTTEKIEENKKTTVDSNITKQLPKDSTSGTSKTAVEQSSAQVDKKTSDTQDIQSDETSGGEPDVPIPINVPKDAVAVKFNLPGQESVEELQKLHEQEDDKETSPSQTSETVAVVAPKKKRKAKRKVVIRRIKRKLSKDDTFLLQQETAAELEICEKEIEEKDLDEEPEEEIPDGPKQPKSCLKNRQFEIGDVVMYAEHYKKTQVRWKKAIVTERITSISYKLNIEGEERPAHISYIKKFTDRKVNFGGKEYLEIDYAQIEENEEKERNYSIWNLV